MTINHKEILGFQGERKFWKYKFEFYKHIVWYLKPYNGMMSSKLHKLWRKHKAEDIVLEWSNI